mmetsp:Transcript_18362/g.28631  ORF Transcript_18362/g.28631 Transcript_18362/m.28631 type:complete len:88 (+) Transcript_18362:664-927(+)
MADRDISLDPTPCPNLSAEAEQRCPVYCGSGGRRSRFREQGAVASDLKVKVWVHCLDIRTYAATCSNPCPFTHHYSFMNCTEKSDLS